MRIIIAIALILSFSTFGQLVTSTMTPQALVQNVLAGPGVEVSNVNYVGSSNSLGYFNGANTNLGLNAGVILTTGTITNSIGGPHGPNNEPGAGVDLNRPGYANLDNLVQGSQTHDATVLEFDFIPFSDTVKFSYIFASEEYPEYVGSDFNDIFAFFISGPGINGLKNMATIPGTNNLPVAINNVNNGANNAGPCMNCQYYTSNGNGSSAPQNSSNTYVQYDGFTIPMQAISKVECGETYHLILAIADVGDGQWDSGIFLEEGSLESKSPVEIDFALSQEAYPSPNEAAEGCVSATFTITRSGPNVVNALSIPVNISGGTATPGVDFTNIPNAVNFNANQTTQTFSFDILQDGLIEGQESVDIQFELMDPCGNISYQTFTILINDLEDVAANVEDVQVICPGELVQLTASGTGGGGNYTYLWSTGETTPSIVVSPLITTTYIVDVTDDCLNQTATTSGTVTVPSYDVLTAVVTDDIIEQCPYVPFTLSAKPEGGAGGYQYTWSDDLGNDLGNIDTINIVPSTTTVYTVTVEDQCNNIVQNDITVTILSPPLLTSIDTPPNICPNDEVVLSVDATGGFGNYYYAWQHSGETTQAITVTPSITTTYIVSVSDDCQTFTVEDTVTVTVQKPVPNFQVTSSTLYEDLPITFQNLTENGETYTWIYGDGHNSNLVHGQNTYDVPGTYDVQLIAVDDIGCIDSITKPVIILPEVYVYIPNTFTPEDGGRFNNTFEASTINVVTLKVQIFNRWGERIFESDKVDFEWDGKNPQGVKVQDGTYVYKVLYTDINGEEVLLNGHINVLR